MSAQRANRTLALDNAALFVSLLEQCLVARLVQQLLKGEAKGAVRFSSCSSNDTSPPHPLALLNPHAGAANALYGPPRENSSQLLHVLLRVAALHAERVQFQQFARVVLVQTTLGPVVALAGTSTRRRGSHRLKVVEIGEHRRVFGRREHHVLESSQ